MMDGWAAEAILRVVPILAFLAGITVVAELADKAGVFAWAAGIATRWGRGSVRTLWLVVIALATLTTVLLSLDTTAVLLTPVVLVVARRIEVPPWPFALATVWMANTASLLLPVSNLTNLLLVDQLSWSVTEYTARMWLPAAVAIAVSIVVLGVLLRGALRGSYTARPQSAPTDRLLFLLAVFVCLAVGPLVVGGVAPWIVSVSAAAVLTVAFVLRDRAALAWRLLPWRIVLLTLGLFFTVAVLQQHGLTEWLTALGGNGEGLPDLLRLAGTGAVGSNLVNNLPAYVALEPIASSSPDRMLALLIGTNLGPLITVWASLATLLWRERCRAAGVSVAWTRFAAAGLIGVPVLVVTCTLALWLI